MSVNRTRYDRDVILYCVYDTTCVYGDFFFFVCSRQRRWWIYRLQRDDRWRDREKRVRVGALCRPLNRNLFVHSVLGAAQWTNGLGCQWWWQCGGGALQHGIWLYIPTYNIMTKINIMRMPTCHHLYMCSVFWGWKELNKSQFKKIQVLINIELCKRKLYQVI